MKLFKWRCMAFRERRKVPKQGRLIDIFWGRCDLDAGHEGLHELERGMIHLYWSTDWVI